MSGTSLIKCVCSHEFQDATYGKQIRVANETKKGHQRCTVCGKEHEARYATVAVKKRKG